MKERKMAVHVITFLSNRLEDSKSFPIFAIEKEKTDGCDIPRRVYCKTCRHVWSWLNLEN